MLQCTTLSLSLFIKMKVLLSKFLVILVWSSSCDAHTYPDRFVKASSRFVHACVKVSYYLVNYLHRICPHKERRQDNFMYYVLAEQYPTVLCQSDDNVS